ncbi:MAG: thermonuclease family protein [Gemmatimonadales bacterium]
MMLALMLSLILTATPPGDCVIRRIVDGDTFYCADGRKVRLIGIDSPELGQGKSGRDARDVLQGLMPLGRSVRLEADAAPRDRWGRTLAWAWSGNRLVNEAMVRGGWAVLYTVPPNVKYAGRLERAQKEAREARAGLWGTGGFECLPSAYRRSACLRPASAPGGPEAGR